MGRPRGQDFAERAFRDGIPLGAVALACRNWGLPYRRAADLAEQAASEAHCRALDREFDGEDHYRAWVTRTAVNCAVDLLRQANRARSLPPDVPGFLPRSDAGPDAADLAEAMSLLSEEDRDILHMTFVENLTLDEIADRTPSAGPGSANARRLRVKRRRDVALERLREYLERLGKAALRGTPLC
jgi:DNA-directed RNA polymerase specialized sigma24 family protein